MGVSWIDFERQAPELARLVRERIEDHGLALIATVAADGSPRISPVEPFFHGGDLWIGSMPGSTKGKDLGRDPRLAMHNATIDKDVSDGDVKLNGVAVLVTDRPAEMSEMPPGADLFRIELTRASSLRVAGDHLVIETWEPGRPVRSVNRY